MSTVLLAFNKIGVIMLLTAIEAVRETREAIFGTQ